MKLKQLIGPFTNADDTKLVLENVTYMQIGIEHPHSVPLFAPESNNELETVALPPLVLSIERTDSNTNNTVLEDIEQSKFAIFEKDILEFYYKHAFITITPIEVNNPYLIINVAYQNDD